jgi:hypothetical protein
MERDLDKKFEKSLTRIITIMILTYLTLYLYMRGIKIPNPELNAVVPAIGFNLSTWGLPVVKRVWEKIRL